MKLIIINIYGIVEEIYIIEKQKLKKINWGQPFHKLIYYS